MGAVNCRNCKCNRKYEEENEEVNPEINLKEEAKKTTNVPYFRNNIIPKNEEINNSDNISNNKDFIEHLKNIQSESKINIDLKEDNLFLIKSDINTSPTHKNINNNTKKETEKNKDNVEVLKDNEIIKDIEVTKDKENIQDHPEKTIGLKSNNNISENLENENKKNQNPCSNQNQNFPIKVDNLQVNNMIGAVSAEHSFEKIPFGIDNKNELSLEDQKLYDEAQKNLNQFFPPEKSEVKVIQSKLKKLSIQSLLPKHKIKEISENKDALVYNGELKKLINYEIKTHRPQMYSMRFCTMTSNVFSYYKSKEQFLVNQRALCVIPLSQITRVHLVKGKKTSKRVDHLILCNKLGILKNKGQSFEEKLIEDLTNTTSIPPPETNESLLIFSSDKEEVLLKWYALLSFFIEME